MSARAKVIAAAAFLLVVAMFLYFTLRFDYLEKDRIGSLVAATNDIVRDYRTMERRLAGENRTPSPEDLSGFLKTTHGKYREIALMAITDSALSLRLSSKNDRHIQSAEVFEAVLKDFTQEKFNITRANPYAVRYYEEKSGTAPEQLKFYIFLNKIGPYRLLVVYPHAVASPIGARMVLEAALLAVFIVVITASVYVAITKKRDPVTGGAGGTIELNLEGPFPSRSEGPLPSDTANAFSDGLTGYVHDLFTAVSGSYGIDAASFYVFHPGGRLVKTMELIGTTFLKIDSVSFDTIDVDNEAGRELRNGATMVLDEGRKIIIPLVYNGTFLGAVNLEKRGALQGGEIGEIKNAIAGVLKTIHDHVIANDVMTDMATGLNSRIYYNLKYHECVRSWKGKGKDFSVLFIRLFGGTPGLGNGEKSGIMKLLAPVIGDIAGNDACICRHDDCIAVILPDANTRKARSMVKQLGSALGKYRIRIGGDAIAVIDPAIGVSSTDGAGPDEDPAAQAMAQLDGRSGA